METKELKRKVRARERINDLIIDRCTYYTQTIHCNKFKPCPLFKKNICTRKGGKCEEYNITFKAALSCDFAKNSINN
jgi:hypothetical protein